MVLALLALVLLVAAPIAAVAVPPPTTSSSRIVLPGEVQTQVEGLQAQAAAVQQEVDRLDAELGVLTERYNQTRVQLDQTNKDLVELRSRLRTTQILYEYRRDRLNDRLTATYKAGRDNLLEILLLTDSLNDFVTRILFISKVTSFDNRLVQGYQTVAADLKSLGKQIEGKKREAMRLERTLGGQRVTIETKLAERRTTLADVNNQVAQIIEQERRRQEQERLRLEAELRARLQTQQSAAAAAAIASASTISGIIPANTDPVLQQVIETAAAYLGVPYVWGGEHPQSGLDCSGLTMYVLRQHGVDLPHYSGDQAQLGLAVSMDTIRTADLVFFGSPVSHVAIYIGDGKIIEAPHTGDVVKISALSAKSTPTHVQRYPVLPRQGSPIWD